MSGIAQGENEEWRPIHGWPYEVSNLGRVQRASDSVNTHQGKMLKPALSGDGYLTVTLYGRTKKTFKVHQLVAVAFLGPPPPAKQCNHRDGRKTNNSASNLEYVTVSENTRHALRLGLQVPMRGSGHPNSKLTESVVREIRKCRAEGTILTVLAARYGVSWSLISQVAREKIWRHVP